MSSSTGSGGVWGQRAAWESESVVESDGRGEREEAAGEAGSEAVQGAGAVAFECEDVLGGPVDRLDPLADRRQVQSLARLVLAARAMDAGAHGGEVGLELLAAEVLVADQRQELAGLTGAARDQLQADLLLVDLRRGQCERSRGAVEREQRVQPEAVEVAAVAGAVAVVGSVGQRIVEAAGAAALDGFARACALDRGAVDEQHIVSRAGAMAGELGDQCLDRVRQRLAALVETVTVRKLGEQVPQALAGRRDEPRVGRDAHHRLRDAERDDLRIGHDSPGVSWLGGQEIVCGAEHRNQQQVEVGEHRGSSWESAVTERTADFDLSVYVPFPPARPPRTVALLI